MNKTIKRSISIFMILIILSACSNLYTPVVDNQSEAVETQVMDSSSPDNISQDTEETYIKSQEEKQSQEEWVRSMNFVSYVSEKSNYSVELYESALLGEQEGGSYREEDFEKNDVLINGFNGDYYLYKQDGEVERVYAEVEFGLQAFLALSEVSDAGLLTNREGNYIPYPVTTYINYIYNHNAEYEITTTEGIEEDVDAIKKALGMEDFDIVQYYACDLNHDGQIEKIITINNSIRNNDYIAENWYDMDFKNYENRILILNQKNEIIQTIDETKNIEDQMEGGSLFNNISFICDIDLDGTMDIIFENAGYEGGTVDVWHFDEQLNVLSKDSHYWGM